VPKPKKALEEGKDIEEEVGKAALPAKY